MSLRFMSQARQTRHFARSASRGSRGDPAIRLKCRVHLVWLIRRLFCRQTKPNTVSTMQLRNYGPSVRFIAIELTELTVMHSDLDLIFKCSLLQQVKYLEHFALYLEQLL